MDLENLFTEHSIRFFMAPIRLIYIYQPILSACSSKGLDLLLQIPFWSLKPAHQVLADFFIINLDSE
jgi:hypothetical protein